MAELTKTDGLIIFKDDQNELLVHETDLIKSFTAFKNIVVGSIMKSDGTDTKRSRRDFDLRISSLFDSIMVMFHYFQLFFFKIIRSKFQNLFAFKIKSHKRNFMFISIVIVKDFEKVDEFFSFDK